MKFVGPGPAVADDVTTKTYVDTAVTAARSFAAQAAAQKVAPVELDFGDEETTANATAFASWAAPGMVVSCIPDPAGNADHSAEDALLEGVTAVVTFVEPGIGFDVVAFCPDATFGRYLFNCVA